MTKATNLHYICNSTRVTALHSCYMKNSLVFSQSDARNFFYVYCYKRNQEFAREERIR